MAIDAAGTSLSTAPRQLNNPGGGTPPPQPETPAEHKDSVTIGRIARKAAKLVTGTAMAAVLGPGTAMNRGMESSSQAALEGMDLQKRCVTNDILKLAIAAAPVVGTVLALAVTNPVTAIAAGFMLPGAIGGIVQAGKGAVTGSMVGLEKASKTARLVENKLEEKYGEKTVAAAKFATFAATAAVAIPVCAFLGAARKTLLFARKAMGLHSEEAAPQKKADTMAGNLVAGVGALNGAVSAAGVTGMLFKGFAGAGAIATEVAGIKGTFEGFVDGVKLSYNLADKAVDRLAGK